MIQVELSIFGVSRIATALMGQVLRDHPDRFWNHTPQVSNGVQVSANVCLMAMKAKQTPLRLSNPFVVDDVTMVPFELETRARRKAG